MSWIKTPVYFEIPQIINSPKLEVPVQIIKKQWVTLLLSLPANGQSDSQRS